MVDKPNFLKIMEDKQYTSDFFNTQMPISEKSAKVILPMVIEFLKVNNALDVGCGTGVWLKTLSQLGVADFIGVDGDYVKTNQLAIPEQNFLRFDLKNKLNLNRKFDLVISSEVAEHLPESCSDIFIESLVSHGDYVLFSAASPGQGGTYHINEQPQEYWVEKFKSHNYLPIDFLRKSIWYKKNVDWWYKQNMILFVKEDVLLKNEILKTKYELFRKDNYNLSHPEMIFHQKNIHSAPARFFENPIYSIRKFISYKFS
jgi:SAM-dependent methyltransferase